MSRAGRRALFLVAAAGLGAVLVLGLTGLPDFGHYRGPYGIVLGRVAVPERKATDVTVSTAFDYRSFDTLVEEFILFTAAIGVSVLLRQLRGEREEPGPEQDAQHGGGPREHASAALRATGAALVAPLVVLGVYVVTHGHLSPGGGFQGGVILAAGLLLVFMAGQRFALHRVRPLAAVELADALGAGGFALVGLGGLGFSAAFLSNLVPLGTPGQLLSGGTIPILNVSVGLEVAGAFVLLWSEFLEQELTRGRGG